MSVHSNEQASASSASQSHAQAQRLRSFRQLLDPIDLLPGHTVADLYSLRHLSLQAGGIPDVSSHSQDGWIRAQAWRVLLGYLSPEKAEWPATLEKRRADYYQFVGDLLPLEHERERPSDDLDHETPERVPHSTLPGRESERDGLLEQIFRDLMRSRKNAFAFYREEIKPSHTCPIAPAPPASEDIKSVERSPRRHGLLHRLESINLDFAHIVSQERGASASASSEPTTSKGKGAEDEGEEVAPAKAQALSSPIDAESSEKPAITLQPASPADIADRGTTPAAPKTFIDRRWHSLLRILYIYALLNPSMGYVQGMNEVLFVILYVMGTSAVLPTSSAADEGRSAASPVYIDDVPGAHAEADAFWCFSSLIGELRELYDFDGIDHASAKLRVTNNRQNDAANGSVAKTAGMGEQLRQFSFRLRWLDEDLWRAMRKNSLDPRLPYYSFRWLACVLSTELSLPSIVRIWDALLAESSESSEASGSAGSPKVDFLIDICCALLTNIREPLLNLLVRDEDDDVEDSFSRGMTILQAYPEDDVGPIVETACLYRQKRLAAPLTGDGPPTEEEDDDMMHLLRNRALNAFREWRSPSASNSPASSWRAHTPRRNIDHLADESFTSSASPSSRFQRYAEAIQTSDAAASLSKTSSNWQAKAMATWNGSMGSPSRQQRSTSANGSTLAELGSTWMQRFRGGNTDNAKLSDSEQDIHPSLRWSTVPPSIPIPDVHDSPPHRHDQPYVRPNSAHVSVNRQAASHALNGELSGSGSRSRRGSNSSSSPDTDYLSPNSSPAVLGIHRFAHLPSLQHAAGMRGLPTQPSSAGPQSNGAGVKPLLLQKAARPPREHSSSGSAMGDEPTSRKVSSGPMAANVSPRGSGFTRRNRGDNASAASQPNSAHTSVSFASSHHRAFAADSPSLSTSSDEPLQARHDGLPLSAAAFPPPLPSLPSKQALMEKSMPPLPISTASITSPLSDTSSRRSSDAPAKATVSASAFAKRDPVPQTSQDANEDAAPLSFGQVASSTNVPLTQKASLQRHRARKSSTSTATTEHSTKAASGGEGDSFTAPSTTMDAAEAVASKVPMKPRGPRDSRTRDSLGYFENPRPAPHAPPVASDEGALSSEAVLRADNEELQRFTLTDGPVHAASTDNEVYSNRSPPSASSKRASSGSGISRSRRTTSGKREAGVRRGSEFGSQRSQKSAVFRFSGPSDVASENDSGERRASASSASADEKVAHGQRRAAPSERGLSNRLAVVAPGHSLAIESGTSVTPSPGPEEGKVVKAEELMELLQGHRENPALAQSQGGSQQQGQDETISVSRADSLRKTSAAEDAAASFSERHQGQSHLLGPRSQKTFLRPPFSEAHSESAMSSEEEFYDAGIEGARTPDFVDAEDQASQGEGLSDDFMGSIAHVMTTPTHTLPSSDVL